MGVVRVVRAKSAILTYAGVFSEIGAQRAHGGRAQFLRIAAGITYAWAWFGPLTSMECAQRTTLAGLYHIEKADMMKRMDLNRTLDI